MQKNTQSVFTQLAVLGVILASTAVAQTRPDFSSRKEVVMSVEALGASCAQQGAVAPGAQQCAQVCNNVKKALSSFRMKARYSAQVGEHFWNQCHGVHAYSAAANGGTSPRSTTNPTSMIEDLVVSQSRTKPSEAPGLDGSWRFSFGDRAFDVVFWPTADSTPQAPRYEGLLYSVEDNCLKFLRAAYRTDRLNRWGIPKTRPRLFFSQGLHIGQRSFFNAKGDGAKVIDEYPELSNNCAVASSDQFVNISAQTNFYTSLDFESVDKWSGKARVAPRDYISASFENMNEVSAKLVRSPLSRTMKRFVSDFWWTPEPIPAESQFASLRTTPNPWLQTQGRDGKRVYSAALQTGSAYLEAIDNGATALVRNTDRQFASLYVKAAATPETRAYRELQSRATGGGDWTDAQEEAWRAYIEKQSLLPAVYVTYLFNFKSKYPSCMGPAPKSVEIPWVEITTTNYFDGAETEQVTAAGVTVRTVPDRLYSRLVPVARAEPYKGAVADAMLTAMASDADRITVEEVIRATLAFMRKTGCGNEAQGRFESQLFALYDDWQNGQAALESKL